jgi:hypothetical protein
MRLEETQKKLDLKEDWETIIEICYGSALNYIAYYCQNSFEEHIDTHKGLPRFLDEHELPELAQLFRDVDHLRMGGWYGGKENGDTAFAARSKLAEIKRRCMKDE